MVKTIFIFTVDGDAIADLGNRNNQHKQLDCETSIFRVFECILSIKSKTCAKLIFLIHYCIIALCSMHV